MDTALNAGLAVTLAHIDARLEETRRLAGDLSCMALTATVRTFFPDAHFVTLSEPGRKPSVVVAVLSEDGAPLWALTLVRPRQQRASDPLRQSLDKYAAGVGYGRQELTLPRPRPTGPQYNPYSAAGYPTDVVHGFYIGQDAS